MTKSRIGIVGAGIGGLSLATALRDCGLVDQTVFERNEGLSSRGGTIRIDPPTQRVLSKIGVLDEVEKTGIRNKYFETHSNGRLVHRMYYATKNDNHLISISREALQRILANNLGHQLIAFNQSVTDIDDEQTTLQFSDGSEQAFDLIIGADGVFSVVANKILPVADLPEFTGLVVYYCYAIGEFLPELAHTEHYISHGGTGFRQVTVAGGARDGEHGDASLGQLTGVGEACRALIWTCSVT
ncbi:MAG: 2-polyprenyl-6-methoxyphenol hydroxylase-like FAD-dependent oxidoreductase [Candidatus Azotimanducaceae bacterium]|jgi:2-polyprenyl-6-methoxyphenol hydroxylase-like FAD-dependent oxidoreductase